MTTLRIKRYVVPKSVKLLLDSWLLCIIDFQFNSLSHIGT